MTRFPNLYLIGAPKAGTTFLFAQLGASPEIITPGNKEPSFFIRASQKYLLHGRNKQKHSVLVECWKKEAYCALFDGWQKEKYAIDASTAYLCYAGVAERIAKARPDAKIIAVLREPVSRTFSHYLMEVRDGWLDESLEEAIEQELEEIKCPDIPWAGHYRLIRNSRYLDGLKSYYRHFGRSNLRVYLFEDIVENIDAVLADMSEFLDINLSKTEKADGAKNAFAVNRFPMLARAVNTYRASKIRTSVNAITSRKARDFIRQKYNRLRLKKQEKPVLTHVQENIVREHLGNDYEESLKFLREKGLLFEPDRHS